MKLAARIAMGVLAVVAVAAVGFGALYTSRIQTANSIEKLTDYDDYNLYRMQVRYDYDLDKMIANTTADNQSFIDAAVKQALPLLPVSIKAPTFGCSAFHIQETGGDHLMGRNYDFKRDTSAMLVCTAPKDGYKSIAFAALDNLGVNQADASTKAKIASLLAPFACLDGINEKFHCRADAGQRTNQTGYRQAGAGYHYGHPPGAGPRRHHRRGRGAAAAVRYVCYQRPRLPLLHHRCRR